MTLRLAVLFGLIAALLPLVATTSRPVVAARQPIRRESGVIAGANQNHRTAAGERYIVVFKEDVANPRDLALQLGRERGLGVTHVYRNVLKGFAARMPRQAAEAMKRHPRVQRVEPDRQGKQAAQSVPTGIKRVGADRNAVAKIDGVDQRVNVDVAVIDGLVQFEHPGLNVYAFADCANTSGFLIPNNHGTHVAGTIGALDNTVGVVGVAPGARIWTYNVVDLNGQIFASYVICALDDIRACAVDCVDPGTGQGLGGIEVANMSLVFTGADGACTSNVLHAAVCRTYGAGVTIVAAAANSCQSVAQTMPANFDQTIAVSALADSDGKRGALGARISSFCDGVSQRVPDDSLAPFSNFGPDVDLAAPGENVRSTVPNGYAAQDGTSMAAPHVAGAAALFKATHPNATPAQVKSNLLSTRERWVMPNDPDAVDEGVLNVAPR